MLELPPILVAGLTGLTFGLLLSIPIGPINLTILNEGAQRGFKWAALIGFGATVMEVIYCFIAFTSFASFFSRGDGQCGGAGVLYFPGDLFRLARIGHPRLAGQARLCGGRRGGHGRMVCGAELGGFARPWQTEREDTTTDRTTLRRIPRAPCADSGRNHHLAVAQ